MPARAHFQECLASAQLDATRINCQTTLVLFQMELDIDGERREAVLERVALARQLLDEAREIIGWESTSVHHIGRTEAGIILPS